MSFAEAGFDPLKLIAEKSQRSFYTYEDGFFALFFLVTRNLVVFFLIKRIFLSGVVLSTTMVSRLLLQKCSYFGVSALATADMPHWSSVR